MRGTDRLLRLTATEADALVDALTAAGFSDGDELVDALLQTKGVLDSTHAVSGPRLRVISEAASPDVAQTVAAACEDAEHHLLEIEYRGADDIEDQTRRTAADLLGRGAPLRASVLPQFGWLALLQDRPHPPGDTTRRAFRFAG